MNFSKNEAGILIFEPKVHEDYRGWFFEVYNKKINELSNINFVQENRSLSHKGVLRGLHYQKTKPQGKFCNVLQGEVLDVVLDIRPSSPTFKKTYSFILSENNKKSIYIPEGFAHGFYTISDVAVFSYRCTDYYDPSDEGGILWDESILDLGKREKIVSEKDAKYPKLNYVFY